MTDLYYIEDDPAIADIVKEYLEQKDFRVTICTSLAQARQTLRLHVPAIVLLDWNMTDGQGDSLCRWIRTNWKELPVIFLTVRGDSRDIVLGFKNGADDYVVKPFDLEVLHSRILALLRRTGNIAEQYLSCDNITIDQNRMSVFCHIAESSHGSSSLPCGSKEEIHLSTSEYQLLLYLMQNKGRTVTRERILEQIWDAKGNYVNDNTLTVTMKRLRDKLHQPACIKTVRSIGYRMEDTI